MDESTALATLPVTGILVDGHTLSLDTVAAVGRGVPGLRLTVPGDADRRMTTSRELKRELIATGIPIYGVTSGFGDSNTRQISEGKSRELQRNLLRFLGSGVGPVAPPEVVRATLLIRANCLARGHSGVRPEVVRLLLDCLAEDILPLIPERGSVGASGDLVPLSYIGRVLTGEGEVLHRGERTDAGTALAAAGLRPVVLEAKEGLALVNGTSFMSGFAAMAMDRAARLAFAADLCTALTSQVLRGNPAHFADFLFEQKPHAGTRGSAARVRWLLKGSASFDQQTERESAIPGDVDFRELDKPIQDRYSIRCAPHVTGVLVDALTWADDWMATEINSSNDNPLFDAGAGVARNGGNFYGGHVGVAMDTLKTTLASVGDLLDRQLELVVDEKFNNGLTPNLIPWIEPGDGQAGLFHGFKGMQITASSLVAEALKNTMPATSFSRSTEAHNQDKVSMGTIAARDAYTVAGLIEQVAAIHLLALCQAADLRGVQLLSPATRAAYDAVREVSAFLDSDRPLAGDIERVAGLIESGRLQAAVADLP
ncbi:aromatic amino acid ammonia-lyase [Streptomyces sp. NPDC000594]|uniref:HAL/PAL/TAL family ammonia-lyase n=1 Tax=Streptomyces sp. NPDC000594 TaxID=3154261 RepID=UPI0033247D31